MSNGNPYVGPRPFSEADAGFYFGRQREARDLLARVVSERLTLFYAQSGAGKSSLLHTRLIPALREEERFWVLPVGRVSGELPEIAGQKANFYATNLMASLDQSDQLPDGLARLKLTDFLSKLTLETHENAEGVSNQRWIYRPEAIPPAPADRAVGGNEPRFILIIDQFEEIISTHPGRWADRVDFLRQLNQAMCDEPNLWVVLTLREDYVASLDPYRSLLENRLRARFRMERMDKTAALDAIKQPAELAGRSFTDGAAQALVNDLCQIRVAGQSATVAGQFVEPVQLQVVCHQLWARVAATRPHAGENDAPRVDRITEDDLAKTSDVNHSLQTFYANTLQAVLADPAVLAAGIHERSLRTWFKDELITETGIRDSVLRKEGDGHAGSMPDVVVDALARRFLVRSVRRSGGTWVEVVHDRFIEPISDNNAAWFEDHVNPLTTATNRWKDAGQSPALLLDGIALADAETYANAHKAEVMDDERLLLVESQRERDRQVKAARQRRRVAAGAVIAAVILAVITAYAVYQGNEARRQRDHAQRLEAQAWAVVAEQQLRVDPVAAMHIALASLPSSENPRPYVPAAEFWLHQAMQLSAETDAALLSKDPLAPEQVSLVPDSESVWIAAGSDSLYLAEVTGIDSAEEAVIGEPALAVAGSHDELAWSDDGRYLLRRIGLLCDGRRPRAGLTVCEPDQERTSSIEVFRRLDGQPDSPLTAVAAFTPAGRSRCVAWLPGSLDVVICQDTAVLRWSPLRDPATAKLLTTMDSPAQSLLGSGDGDWLAVVDEGGNLTIADLVVGAEYRLELPEHPADVLDGAWSSGMSTPSFVAGTNDGRILIWDSLEPAATAVITAGPQGNPVSGLRFVDAGAFVAWGPVSPVRRWSLDGEMLETYRALPADEQVQDVRLSPDGQKLLVFLTDGTARLWSPVAGSTRSVALIGHTQPVVDAAWHPSGRYVATASGDGTARVWDIVRVWDPEMLDGIDNLRATEAATLYGHSNLDADSDLIDLHGVRWLDEARLLTWGEDGSFRIWSVLREPYEQTCDGGPSIHGPQRGFCRQFVAGVRTPEQTQWIDEETLLTASIVPEFMPESMEFLRHLRMNRLDLSTGQIVTTTLDASLLPEVPNRGYLAPPAMVGHGALMPIQHSGARQGETVVSIIDGSAEPVVVASLPPFAEAVRTVAVLDVSTVAAAHGDALTTWQLEDGELSVRWTLPVTGAIASLAWSKDGRRLIVAGEEVELRDARTGNVIWSWHPDPDAGELNADTRHLPYQAAISDDGALLAIAQNRHVAVLPLDVQIAKRAPEPIWLKTHAHDDAIHGLAWIDEEDWPTPENVDSGRPAERSLLLTWSGDGSARLWDWQRDAEIWRAQGVGSIEGAAISPGGTVLVTTYAPDLNYGRAAPGGLRLWQRWSPEGLRDAATAVASRPLSAEQQALIE